MSERREYRCVQCGRSFDFTETERGDFPFCSYRCRALDLARWLDGDFFIDRPMTEDDLARLAAHPEEVAGPEPSWSPRF